MSFPMLAIWHNFAFSAALCLLIQGCATPQLGIYQNAQEAQPASEEERLWHGAREFEAAIRRSNQLYDAPELTHYLQSVMDGLYPEFDGTVHVDVLKEPLLNAFALPNGGVYINIGLLAALENEAQLATVLAHEGIHFTHKHGAKQRQKTIASGGLATAVALLGIPIIGDLTALAAITGYSRELEHEADVEGFERLRARGYALTEAPKAFEQLLREAKTSKTPEPFFFATHPRLQERIDYYNNLIEQTPDSGGGRVGREPYQKQIKQVRSDALAAKIKRGRYASIISVYEDNPYWKNNFRPEDGLFVAEAYRLRGEDEDREQAINILQSLTANKPKYSPPFLKLGELYYMENRFIEARIAFEHYLALSKNKEGRKFALFYLKKIKKGLP